MASSEATNNENTATNNVNWKTANSIHEFTVKDLDGNEVKLDKYKGKVVLIVNVASNCGLTRNNYKQLNELYAKLKDKPFAILAFPCNQFAGQEPACDIDLKEYMKKNNVEFDAFAKCNVNGSQALPLYDYLKNKKGGFFGNFIKWNFTKFLVNKNGEPVKRYGPNTEPKDIEKDITPLLE